jgi:hypothetical protein
LADMETAVTTEADLRRLYEELEACRLLERKSGAHRTRVYTPDRFLAVIHSLILRSASFFGAAVSAFGRSSSASRMIAARDGRFRIGSELQDASTKPIHLPRRTGFRPRGRRA